MWERAVHCRLCAVQQQLFCCWDSKYQTRGTFFLVPTSEESSLLDAYWSARASRKMLSLGWHTPNQRGRLKLTTSELPVDDCWENPCHDKLANQPRVHCWQCEFCRKTGLSSKAFSCPSRSTLNPSAANRTLTLASIHQFRHSCITKHIATASNVQVRRHQHLMGHNYDLQLCWRRALLVWRSCSSWRIRSTRPWEAQSRVWFGMSPPAIALFAVAASTNRAAYSRCMIMFPTLMPKGTHSAVHAR